MVDQHSCLVGAGHASAKLLGCRAVAGGKDLDPDLPFKSTADGSGDTRYLVAQGLSDTSCARVAAMENARTRGEVSGEHISGLPERRSAPPQDLHFFALFAPVHVLQIQDSNQREIAVREIFPGTSLSPPWLTKQADETQVMNVD